MTPNLIASRLDLSLDKATEIHELIEGERDPLTYVSVQAWVQQCFHHPNRKEMAMCAINEILEGHGVEGLRVEGAYVSAAAQDVIASYVNMGDTYACTVLRDTEFGEFHLTSYGDFLEAWELENPPESEESNDDV